MAEIDIFDAFDDGIDRLNKGEMIEEILGDYPDYADQLRGLLTAGNLVYQAQSADAEVKQAEAQIRTQLNQRAEKPKPQRRFFTPLAIAASFALVVGVLSVLTLARRSNAPNDIELTSTHIAVGNSTTVALGFLTATAIAPILDPTDELWLTFSPSATPLPLDMSGLAGTATPRLTTTPQPTMTVTATATVTVTATSTRSDSGLVSTSVALMSPVPGTATAAGTAAPPPTIPAGGSIDDPEPTIIAILPTAGMMGVTTFPPVLITPTLPMSPAPILPTSVQVIPLSAGEIDDNARWDTYLQYRQNYLSQYPSTVHDVNVSGRQIIAVTDEQGLPVLGALVQVYVGQSLISETRTYATGETMFFTGMSQQASTAQSFQVVVSKFGMVVQFVIDPHAGSVWQVTLPNTQRPSPVKLDVLFLLDTTSSMDDEIAQLQNNLMAISGQISELPGGVDVRYGLVTYRDRGDEYISQIYDFVGNVGSFQATLGAVRSGGGGDTPESLNEGLHWAVQGVSWRGTDTIKLIFLVADAPPHLDYAQDYDYAQEMMSAARIGIKIHPIASSGLSPDGEFIFRQIAQYTMGHFLFLTYQQGSAGAPGEVRPDLHVGTPSAPAQGVQGDYSVENLDDLVLRLITDEIGALNQPVNVPGVVIPALMNGQTQFINVSPTPTYPPPPTITPTATSTPPPLPTPPPTLQSGFMLTVDWRANWPLLLTLGMAVVFLGYLVKTRPMRHKRKNEEMLED